MKKIRRKEETKGKRNNSLVMEKRMDEYRGNE